MHPSFLTWHQDKNYMHRSIRWKIFPCTHPILPCRSCYVQCIVWTGHFSSLEQVTIHFSEVEILYVYAERNFLPETILIRNRFQAVPEIAAVKNRSINVQDVPE